MAHGVADADVFRTCNVSGRVWVSEVSTRRAPNASDLTPMTFDPLASSISQRRRYERACVACDPRVQWLRRTSRNSFFNFTLRVVQVCCRIRRCSTGVRRTSPTRTSTRLCRCVEARAPHRTRHAPDVRRAIEKRKAAGPEALATRCARSNSPDAARLVSLLKASAERGGLRDARDRHATSDTHYAFQIDEHPLWTEDFFSVYRERMLFGPP